MNGRDLATLLRALSALGTWPGNAALDALGFRAVKLVQAGEMQAQVRAPVGRGAACGRQHVVQLWLRALLRARTCHLPPVCSSAMNVACSPHQGPCEAPTLLIIALRAHLPTRPPLPPTLALPTHLPLLPPACSPWP